MSTYEGQSKDGVRHGFGSLLYDNGDRYIGQWRKGLMHGLGVYLSKSGDTYYGQYDNGKWNGFGFMELSNGERRFGEWQDNKFHGLNIGKKNDEFEIGRMENNFLNGKSAIFKEDGTIIECGIFDDGKLTDEERDFDEDNDDYGWFPGGSGASGSVGRTSNDDRSDSLNPNSPRYNPGRRK